MTAIRLSRENPKPIAVVCTTAMSRRLHSPAPRSECCLSRLGRAALPPQAQAAGPGLHGADRPLSISRCAAPASASPPACRSRSWRSARRRPSGAGASSPAASYPSRLEVELKAAFPDAHITVLNRGVNGEDAADMLARFDKAVFAEQPDLVIWQVGTNSVLRDTAALAAQSRSSRGRRAAARRAAPTSCWSIRNTRRKVIAKPEAETHGRVPDRRDARRRRTSACFIASP